MSNTKSKRVGSVQESSEQTQAQWARVYEAVAERWPLIDQGDLPQCRQSVDAITDFVSQRVEAAKDEVSAAVGEFAPASSGVLEPMAEKINGLSGDVAETVHSAVERVQYEIDEAPVKTSLGALAIGFALGVLATTAYVRAQHEATAWEKVRDRFAG